MLNEMLRGELEKEGATIERCGSTVTCNPAPTGTDIDYLVQLPASDVVVSRVTELLANYGFVWEGDTEHYQSLASSLFMSWRQKNVNLIVTAAPHFADKHRVATLLCTRLNLRNKQDRIAVFQAVLYANVWNK